MDGRDAVTAYYEAIDAGAYDRLESLLVPEFVQHRPDRTLEGRERFVRFMREDRPRTDTEHVVGRVCVCAADRDGDADAGTAATAFVEGRLRAPDGDDLFGFVDVHRIERGRIAALSTYTD